MNIWSPFTRCHVNAEHKIRYNEIFFKKKKINTICIVQRNINCLITNIIQQIFCLPQAKKCIQCWNFFEWTFPLSANPTPQMISLVKSIRQSVTCREKFSAVDKTNEICGAEFVLNWFEKKNTKILQLPAVFNYDGNGKSSMLHCGIQYSVQLCWILHILPGDYMHKEHLHTVHSI